MKFYFLSSRPCALKLGGVYFGVVNDFERFIDLSPKENVFVEFVPENAQPISFFITEQIRFTPPERCEVYLLPNAVAIYARDFYSTDPTLYPLLQKSFDNGLITVFFQGALQISLETERGFFVQPLPPSFQAVDISYHGGLYFIEGKNALLAFTPYGKEVLNEQVLTFSFEENTLNATLPLADSKKRYANCSWLLSEAGAERQQFTVVEKSNSDDLLPNGLLAYAFFESVLIGANYAAFLCDELQSRAAEVKEFLGSFREVLPTERDTACDLVYQKADRLFEVKRFEVEIKEGKIVDFKG